MKNNVKYLLLAIAIASVTGCGLLKKYNNEAKAPENLAGSDEVVERTIGESSIGDISWRDLFCDQLLLDLIDTALVRNVDVNSAKLVVKQADEALKAAKLSFIPTLSFNPSYSYDGGHSYSLPFSINWNTPGFGSRTNSLREANALALQAADNEEAVRSMIVAQVAKTYLELQSLDRQLEILDQTCEVWQQVCDTQRALMENGKAYSPSVNQLEASLVGVRIQRVDTEEHLRDVEYALCLLLAETPHKVARNPIGSFNVPDAISIGVPAALLEKRPDVRSAAREVEAAYYAEKISLAAMFPSISLTGMLGWTNGGVKITDPIQMVYNAVASLAQPIFAGGQLRAKYKISQFQREDAANRYAQAILKAGNEVNAALRECKNAAGKESMYQSQVAMLQDAYDATAELMKNGKAAYVEVLMAQNSLLEAQLSMELNRLSGRTSLINLYIALGGGV